ncbi:MAG: hypothetical protein AAGN35_18900 [Bacteroidota bacterium]
MGLFDPSKEDHNEHKKPRHWQDFIVVFVVLGMVLIYLLLEWLVL